MHAFLIVGKDKNKIEEKIQELSKKSQILNFSIEKIENVRELSQFLKLSQINKTLVALREVDNATIEALNSFLKNLEEPGKNITFILTATNEYKIIPTILSRCQIIRIGSANKIFKPENIEDVTIFLEENAGGKLKIISGIKNRDDAKYFLENIIYFLHSKIISDDRPDKSDASKLKRASETLTSIESNGNVSLQLTNFVIQLEKNIQ